MVVWLPPGYQAADHILLALLSAYDQTRDHFGTVSTPRWNLLFSAVIFVWIAANLPVTSSSATGFCRIAWSRFSRKRCISWSTAGVSAFVLPRAPGLRA